MPSFDYSVRLSALRCTSIQGQTSSGIIVRGKQPPVWPPPPATISPASLPNNRSTVVTATGSYTLARHSCIHQNGPSFAGIAPGRLLRSDCWWPDGQRRGRPAVGARWQLRGRGPDSRGDARAYSQGKLAKAAIQGTRIGRGSDVAEPRLCTRHFVLTEWSSALHHCCAPGEKTDAVRVHGAGSDCCPGLRYNVDRVAALDGHSREGLTG